MESDVKVLIKEFDVEMELKNKGIELEVRNDDKHQGDLVLTKAAVIWCPGKTTRDNGKKLSWAKFIELMEAQ
jgi:hypothetical protein